ncbi:Transcription initiation factor TFIID subunit 7 [Exophiala dermatitidis]
MASPKMKKQSSKKPKPTAEPLDETAASTFVTFKVSPAKLRPLNLRNAPPHANSNTNNATESYEAEATYEDTHEVEDKSSVESDTESDTDDSTTTTGTANYDTATYGSRQPEASPDADTFYTNDSDASQPASRNLNTKKTTATTNPARHGKRHAKSIRRTGPISATSTSAVGRRQAKRAAASKAVAVTAASAFDASNNTTSSPGAGAGSNGENETQRDSDSDDLDSSPSTDSDTDAVSEMSDTPDKRPTPSLKLKIGRPSLPPAEPVQTPNPSSGTRTPLLKLKLGTAAPASTPPASTQGDTINVEPLSSSKKRKRLNNAEAEDELARQAPKTKIKFKTGPVHGPKPPKPPPAAPVVRSVKIKAKGKPPKRPLGVGYDSELEDREADPVIHEGFILRMQPGPDCDYVRQAIEDKTIGKPRAQGGPDIRIRMLDTLGRRGVLIVRGNQYATTMVDLPCIIEGMKSWDKKGCIKSIDISQMLLVLGRCNTDEEAKNYPLPEDVDPKNYQYAHGITAPMKWVRKRRFARTKRARVDDIEAVERRVNALLEADRAAVSTKYQLLDHDPRLDEERYSSGLDGEDDDAEGEYDDYDEGDGYFDPRHVPHNGAAVETPTMYTETQTPVEQDVGQDEIDEFERMFAAADDLVASEAAASQAAQANTNTLQVPEAADSSFAVTSTSASPSNNTVAPTPAEEASSDEDDDDEIGDAAAEDDDQDLDDAEKEGDENLQQIKDRIQDMQHKIAEQTAVLKQTQNAILKKKLARKIQDLKDDVAMMKKNAGLGGDDDDD